jgi:hypothetical protein
MNDKTAKQLMNEIGWKREMVISTHKALMLAETAHREAGWKLDEAIQALADLATVSEPESGEQR